MYIKKILIQNVKAIEKFEMSFAPRTEAGWHVLIGDNGSGKSTISQAIALGLVREHGAISMSNFEDFSAWLPSKSTSPEEHSIAVTVVRDNDWDKPTYQGKSTVKSTVILEKTETNGINIRSKLNPKNSFDLSGWFSAAYGPFRRLQGGSSLYSHILYSKPRVAAHLSIFRVDMALTHIGDWLKDLALDAKKEGKSRKILQGIVDFVNHSKLLPENAVLTNEVTSQGICFKDQKGAVLQLDQMSDGYRSVLSCILDILRHALKIYKVSTVFPNDKTENMRFPGVVIIDEIDVHLHPTWQIRIGQWFTRVFPNIQFIVTTHSPLICRAAINGSIWRLPPPNQRGNVEELKGHDLDMLLYGNVLDAYSTNAFGEGLERSLEGQIKRERFALLARKVRLDPKATKEEKKELKSLEQLFKTDATIDL